MLAERQLFGAAPSRRPSYTTIRLLKGIRCSVESRECPCRPSRQLTPHEQIRFKPVGEFNRYPWRALTYLSATSPANGSLRHENRLHQTGSLAGHLETDCNDSSERPFMGLAGLLLGEADLTRAVLGYLERPRRTPGVQCRYETSRPNRGECDARVRGHAEDSAGAGSQDGGVAQDPVRQSQKTAAASFAPTCTAMGRSVELRCAVLQSGPRSALIELLVAQRNLLGMVSSYGSCDLIGDASATVANRETAAIRSSRVDRLDQVGRGKSARANARNSAGMRCGPVLPFSVARTTAPSLRQLFLLRKFQLWGLASALSPGLGVGRGPMGGSLPRSVLSR